MSGKASRDHSRDLQEKFELYMVGLVFTVLAAAVQTAKFGVSAAADKAELASWSLLLVSGLAGMLRMELVARIHGTHGQVQDGEGIVKDLDAMAEAPGLRLSTNGQPLDLLALRKEIGADVDRLEAQEGSQRARSNLAYSASKWGFVVGLVLLIVARGYVPARGLMAAAAQPAAASSTPAPHTGPTSASAPARAGSH